MAILYAEFFRISDFLQNRNLPVFKIIDYFVLFQSEDCLNLNIYIPLKSLESDEKLPVLVFIHGGAFFVGSNHDGPLDGDPDSNEDDPSYFVQSQNIIVVKINYRVGPLGFWYFEDDIETKNNGNWALQDQELALKWIDEHIEAFGGDRTKSSFI